MNRTGGEEGGLAVVYSTFPSPEEARRIGEALVRERLAACVNMFPGMISIYEWDDRVDSDEETAMIIKTQGRLADEVMERVKALHSYDTPAFLVFPVSGSSEAFAAWIREQTRAKEAADR